MGEGRRAASWQADDAEARQQREVTMKAKVGDRVVTEGAHVDAPRRTGEVIEVSHADGEPPYRVRWEDGHESLWSPGADSHVVTKQD
jgi:Domain of unknown function (DUF1918)